MKKTRIAMVIVCLIYIAAFGLSMALSQPIREGKVADDWIVVFSLVMAATLVANIVLSHRYAIERRAFGYRLGDRGPGIALCRSYRASLSTGGVLQHQYPLYAGFGTLSWPYWTDCSASTGPG